MERVHKPAYEHLLSEEDLQSSDRPLLNSIGDDDVEKHGHLWTSRLSARGTGAATRTYKIGFALSVLLNLFWVAGWAWRAVSDSTGALSSPGARQIYSPVNDILQYHDQVFQHPRFPTKYQGTPTKELDREWEALYNHGIFYVGKEEASHLNNFTVAVAGEESSAPERYPMSLDVFHQLHCLNMLRKSLWPEYYPAATRYNETTRFGHLDHCIESLRQSLTCSADVSPIVYRWNDKFEKNLAKLNTVHSCRNFDVVRDWAFERWVEEVTVESEVHASHQHHDDESDGKEMGVAKGH